MVVIKTKNLTKRFKDLLAVDDVNLEVEEGVVVLLPTLRVDEEVYHLPSYEVPLSDYEAGMSLPAHLEEELVRLLRRKFR